MPRLTISEAARLCGINRRTLQRAVQAGRLHLTDDHRVDTVDLHRAGYAVSVSHLDAALVSHMDTVPTPHSVAGTPEVPLHCTAPVSQRRAARMSQAIERLAAAIEAILAEVTAIRTHLLSQVDAVGTPHHVTVTPQVAPQADAAPLPHHDTLTPQETPHDAAEAPHAGPATAEGATTLPPHVLAIAEVAAQYDKLSLADLSQLLFDRGIYRATDRATKAERPVNRGTLLKWLGQAREAGVL